MGYIDDTLMNDEKVVYRTRLHWIVIAIPTFFALIMAIISYLLLAAGGDAAAIGYFFFLLLFAALIWVISSVISYKTAEFAVTNKRVLAKVGWIRRHSIEIILIKVEGIIVNQGILARILRYGTIIVTGTGSTKEPFHKIIAPMEFRKQVQIQVAAAHDSK